MPQCQAKNGNLNSRGCAMKTQPFCGQLRAAGGFGEHQGRFMRAPEHALPLLCACLQADGCPGVTCSQPSDLSGAHGRCLSVQGIKVKHRARLGSLSCLSELPALRHPGQQGSGL